MRYPLRVVKQPGQPLRIERNPRIEKVVAERGWTMAKKSEFNCMSRGFTFMTGLGSTHKQRNKILTYYLFFR
jgi:hypothetical protein